MPQTHLSTRPHPPPQGHPGTAPRRLLERPGGPTDADLEGPISGHSLRAGASVVEMQTAGRWQSPPHAGPLPWGPRGRPPCERS